MGDSPGKVKKSREGQEKKAIQRLEVSMAVVHTARGRVTGGGLGREAGLGS